MFFSNIVRVHHHILYHNMNVSDVHVPDLIAVMRLCTTLCACWGVYRGLEVAGGIYRVSREGDKWGRGFSSTSSLPSYLLYSDGCSQSVQEEATLPSLGYLPSGGTWSK